MRLPASERQRRLDTLRRQLETVRQRARGAMTTARTLDATGDRGMRSLAKSARQRARAHLAAARAVEHTLNVLALELAQRPPGRARTSPKNLDENSRENLEGENSP